MKTRKRNGGHIEKLEEAVLVVEEEEEDCFLGIEIKIDICLKFQTFLGFAIACQKHFLGFALPFLNLCVVFFFLTSLLHKLVWGFSWFKLNTYRSKAFYYSGFSITKKKITKAHNKITQNQTENLKKQNKIINLTDQINKEGIP